MGGGGVATTVSTAAALAVEPAALLTCTRECAPLSANCTAASSTLAFVWPPRLAQVAPASLLRCHW